MEYVSELEYLDSVVDESSTDEVERCTIMTSGRRVEGAIKSLVNTRKVYFNVRRCFLKV